MNKNIDVKEIVYCLEMNARDNAINVKYHDEEIAYLSFDFRDRKCLLHLIKVEEEYRGLGLGTVLLHILENMCIENSIKSIEGRYYPENQNAVEMYKKHGYEVYRDGYEQYIMKYVMTKHELTNINIEQNKKNNIISDM